MEWLDLGITKNATRFQPFKTVLCHILPGTQTSLLKRWEKDIRLARQIKVSMKKNIRVPEELNLFQNGIFSTTDLFYGICWFTFLCSVEWTGRVNTGEWGVLFQS